MTLGLRRVEGEMKRTPRGTRWWTGWWWWSREDRKIRTVTTGAFESKWRSEYCFHARESTVCCCGVGSGEVLQASLGGHGWRNMDARMDTLSPLSTRQTVRDGLRLTYASRSKPASNLERRGFVVYWRRRGSAAAQSRKRVVLCATERT